MKRMVARLKTPTVKEVSSDFLLGFARRKIRRETKTDDGLQAEAEVPLKTYLKGEAKKLIPFLRKQLKKKEPREFAYMIYALIELNYIKQSEIVENQTGFIKAINSSLRTKRKLGRKALAYHKDQYEARNFNMMREIRDKMRKINSELQILNILNV